MLIAILNQSTLVTPAECATMTQAVAKQVRFDAAPAWDRAPAAVVFYSDPSAVPEQAHGIAVVDAVENQPKGVLGFHTEDPGGKLWGVVAAKPELDNGGKVTTGDWSVSSVLSHEVLEMFVDPNCNLWANNNRGSAYSYGHSPSDQVACLASRPGTRAARSRHHPTPRCASTTVQFRKCKLIVPQARPIRRLR